MHRYGTALPWCKRSTRGATCAAAASPRPAAITLGSILMARACCITRYYDPVLERFIAADSVVPGNAAGSMDGVAVKPLTVAFHELPFLTKLNGENRRGFWFELSDQERQQVGSPWEPSNPPALNRSSYVQNNPLRYTDPSGHCVADLCVMEAAVTGTFVWRGVCRRGHSGG